MRIVKTEKIFLSQNEADILNAFGIILEGLEKGCKNPDNVNLIKRTQFCLEDLWGKVTDVE